MLCLSTALAVLASGPQARADGDSSKHLAPPPPARVTTSGSVSVDMSALDSVPNRRLLLPGTGAAPLADGPVRLRPPPGVKPVVQAPIRLRPPPGVQMAAPAPAKAPETKMAAITQPPATPAPVAKAEAPKPAPPPAAQTPAPGQPRSLLTPPASSAPTPPPAAAVASATPAPAAPAKTGEVKPAGETAVAVATPPARTPDQPDTFSIAFKVGAADVPADSTAGLKALAAKLAKDPTARLQLVAYASDPEKSISRSRRLSLERAVNVRKVMLAAGIESTRIDIRALGEQSGSGAPDRVDAVTVKR